MAAAIAAGSSGSIRIPSVSSASTSATASTLGRLPLPGPLADLAATRWDALVVGAGHNGLTCAAYLARAGLKVDGLQTLLVIDGDRSWQHTAAILRVLHTLDWPWRFAWVGWLVPAPLRDALYRWVARNRYRIWGRSEVCMVPLPETAARFLD